MLRVEVRRGGVGNVVVFAVRERHIAGAQIEIGLEQRQIATDHKAVLYPDRHHELATGNDALHVVCGVGDLDLVRIHLLRHPMDGVEFGHRTGLGLRLILRSPFGLADVDDEKPGVESAGSHLGQIHLEVVRHARVDFPGRIVERDVDVSVERQHPFVNGARLLEERILR